MGNNISFQGYKELIEEPLEKSTPAPSISSKIPRNPLWTAESIFCFNSDLPGNRYLREMPEQHGGIYSKTKRVREETRTHSRNPDSSYRLFRNSVTIRSPPVAAKQAQGSAASGDEAWIQESIHPRVTTWRSLKKRCFVQKIQTCTVLNNDRC